MAQEYPVYNTKGSVVEKINLDKKVFDGEVNQALLHQVVVAYQTNKRVGTASTKTRGEVSGGGKKPWKQKGTGRARVGSSRNPLWRHGGVTFGPHTRDMYDAIPRQVRVSALKSSLNAKVNDKEMLILDALKIEKPKTKEFAVVLKNLKIADKTLMVMDKADENIMRSSKNLSNLTIKMTKDINALDVMNHAKLLITKDALKTLTKRI